VHETKKILKCFIVEVLQEMLEYVDEVEEGDVSLMAADMAVVSACRKSNLSHHIGTAGLAV
jgi:hypothetical protein